MSRGSSGLDSGSNSSSGGIEEWLVRDMARNPAAEYLDLNRRTGRRAPGHVRVCDRTSHRVAEASAGDATGVASDPDGLGSERNRSRVIQHQAGQPGRGRRFASSQQRPAPGELAFVQLDAKAKARLKRVGLRTDVRAPNAVSLLESQRIDSLVAAGDEAMIAAGLPKRVPQALPEL